MATRKPSIDQELIRDLANILNETDLTEIEIEQDDLRVRVSRAGTPQMIHAPVAQPQASAPQAAAAPQAEAAPAAAAPSSANAVTAPMVGTVYLQPEPGAKAFVGRRQGQGGPDAPDRRGDEDHEPDPRPRAGTVKRILVEASPVEYARTADDHRVSEAGVRCSKDPDRQPRRDRAARVRACREMGMKTVAVHSTADADAMHVRMADEASASARRPPPTAISAWPPILSACEITGAEAIHPGYGFLSENANFVQILEDHGITFIGPSAEHIRIMGDKITAKDRCRLGIPCVPGSEGGVRTWKRRRRSPPISAIRSSSRRPPAAAGAA
jgi:hypothetical protein